VDLCRFTSQHGSCDRSSSAPAGPRENTAAVIREPPFSPSRNELEAEHAVLQPTASLPLLGVPAAALADRHAALADRWGSDIESIRDRLREVASPHGRLAVFEGTLAARLPSVYGVHPAVAYAVARFEAGADVRTVVAEIGYSHRWLLTAFRDAVGLPPEAYSRVLRIQPCATHATCAARIS